MAIIEYDSISFTYPNGTDALFDVSLSINEKDIVAIVGQNGGGKTTLVKMTNGLLHPTKGCVRLFGKDITDTSTAKISRHVGFVFQNPRTQIFLNTVAAETSFGPKRLGMPESEVEERVEAALRLVGLQDKRETHPYDLVAPERKLLAIASIISMDPEILILDEPSGGMDLASLDRVAQVIDTYRAQGRTVITISHDMDFVARCFDRVVVINQGRIVKDDVVRDVFSDHDLLAGAHLEPTAIGQLSASCGFPRSIITVPEMVDYIEVHRGAGAL
jgi:energy-coupling factor transporter ATP-binding protein EcfA2